MAARTQEEEEEERQAKEAPTAPGGGNKSVGLVAKLGRLMEQNRVLRKEKDDLRAANEELHLQLERARERTRQVEASWDRTERTNGYKLMGLVACYRATVKHLEEVAALLASDTYNDPEDHGYGGSLERTPPDDHAVNEDTAVGVAAEDSSSRVSQWVRDNCGGRPAD